MNRIYISSKRLLKNNIFVIVVLLIGLALRINTYTQNPPRGSSSDEYTYAFLGMSLLEKGVPTSWSYFPQYQNYGHTYKLTIDHIFFPMVTPYFDHPPFNGILVGGWAMINGQTTYQSVKIGTIRQIPIALGMLSSILVYLLAFKIYGKKTAIWSLLIYSTATIIVLETRTVFAENLLTPLFLSALLILHTFKKRLPLFHVIILGIIAGLAFWTKELGIVVFLSIISILFLEKTKLKTVIIFACIFIFIVSLYFLYGYIYNWELFKAIIFAQGSRDIGPQTLYTLFLDPILVNKQYFDGWYFLGFVSFFAAFLSFTKNKFLLIPSFLYFFLMLFSLTSKAEMGWYMIPMFPFFAIFTAHILNESIKNKGWYIFIVTLFIGMFITQYRIAAKYGLSNPEFRLILIILFLPLFLSYIFNKEKLFTLLSNAWFYILIIGTILITYRYIHPL